MQPHLTPQPSSYTKHGGDVYSTCLPNALKQGLKVDLVWCDSLQRDGRQPLSTYAQYYQFLETETNRPQAFQPTRHYTSALRMRMHTPALM